MTKIASFSFGGNPNIIKYNKVRENGLKWLIAPISLHISDKYLYENNSSRRMGNIGGCLSNPPISLKTKSHNRMVGDVCKG